MSNVPDDWTSYWRDCDACGGQYHASGVDGCECLWCAECGTRFTPEADETRCAGCLGVMCEGCDERHAPDEMASETLCIDCLSLCDRGATCPADEHHDSCATGRFE